MIAITWAYRWEAAREGNSRVGFAPAQPCGPDLHRDIARRSHSRALWLGKLITVSRAAYTAVADACNACHKEFRKEE
jgi:hypothetical protein